jgi:hypothetical protein
MTVKFRGIPTYEEPLTTGSKMSSSWRRWVHDTEVGTPPTNETKVLVTASPFSYQAPSRGMAIISGGSVSQVAFSRTTGMSYVTGQTSGMFPVSLGDTLTVTYSGVPSFVFVPS